MFEKESEDYSTNWKIHKNANLNYAEVVELRAVIYKAHKEGAEFGYNKANEWQFPSKGKYPKENKRYLCKIKAFVGGGISYECFDYDTEYNSWKEACGEVIAWKEIVLPKEIE